MKDFIKRSVRRFGPYLVFLGLVYAVFSLVRANYVWVGFQQKDYYTDLQVCKSDTGRLSYQISELKQARDRANADILGELK
jgi:hypothetical protein